MTTDVVVAPINCQYTDIDPKSGIKLVRCFNPVVATLQMSGDTQTINLCEGHALRVIEAERKRQERRETI